MRGISKRDLECAAEDAEVAVEIHHLSSRMEPKGLGRSIPRAHTSE